MVWKIWTAPPVYYGDEKTSSSLIAVIYHPAWYFRFTFFEDSHLGPQIPLSTEKAYLRSCWSGLSSTCFAYHFHGDGIRHYRFLWQARLSNPSKSELCSPTNKGMSSLFGPTVMHHAGFRRGSYAGREERQEMFPVPVGSRAFGGTIPVSYLLKNAEHSGRKRGVLSSPSSFPVPPRRSEFQCWALLRVRLDGTWTTRPNPQRQGWNG